MTGVGLPDVATAVDDVLVRGAPARRRRFDWPVWLLRLVPLLALAAVWTVYSRSEGLKGDIFPSPASIWSALVTIITDGTYGHHLWATTQEFLAAFVLAAAAGIVIGVVVGSSRTLTELLEPLFLLVYSVPRIALFPIFLAIFGIGMESKIALGFVSGFFPVFVNTLAGMKGISRTHVDVARSLGASRGQRLRKVAVPSIFGPIVTGLRLGITLTIIGVLIGEILQSRQGVGFYVYDRYSLFAYPEMYAGIIATVMIVFLINLGINRVERSLLRWRS
jgi:NitT/TauT family transport system permease protein